MVKVQKISKVELPVLVYISYLGDEDLLSKYHIKPVVFPEAIEITCDMIYELAERKRLNYYKVIYQKKPIGYIVTFDNCLYSFSINKEFRVKDILIAYWQAIKKVIGNSIYCRLYANNQRAILWLEKCGMKITYNENNIVQLNYN